MKRDTQKSATHQTTEDASGSPGHQPQQQQHQFHPSAPERQQERETESDADEVPQSKDDSDYGGPLDLDKPGAV